MILPRPLLLSGLLLLLLTSWICKARQLCQGDEQEIVVFLEFLEEDVEGCKKVKAEDFEKFTIENVDVKDVCSVDESFCEIQLCVVDTITVSRPGRGKVLFRLLDETKTTEFELENPGNDICGSEFKCEACADILFFVADDKHDEYVFKVDAKLENEPEPAQKNKNDSRALISGMVIASVFAAIIATIVLIIFFRRKLHEENSPSNDELSPVTPPMTGGKMVNVPGIGTKPFHLNSNSPSPKVDHRMNFLRFSSEKKPSKLSIIFRKDFVSRETSPFQRLTGKTGISDSTVNSYKKQLTTASSDRDKRMKAVSLRLSENYSRINELLGLSEGTRTLSTPAWLGDPKLLVKRVSDHLKGEILSAEEVDNLERMDRTSPLSDFSVEASTSIDLEFYLFRLVTGLNKWFLEDSKSEIVGMRSLLFAMIYLRKIRNTVPLFGLTFFNVHRVFAILVLVAAKFTEDELISNAYWGDVCGLTMEEVNNLEEAFCFSSEFDFFVTPAELDEMGDEFGLNFPRVSSHCEELSI